MKEAGSRLVSGEHERLMERGNEYCGLVRSRISLHCTNLPRRSTQSEQIGFYHFPRHWLFIIHKPSKIMHYRLIVRPISFCRERFAFFLDEAFKPMTNLGES